MEKETKKMTKEEQLKIINDLIDEYQKTQEQLNKAIKDLGDSVIPCVLEDLGYQLGDIVRKIAELERMKDKITNQGLGNEYAERAFGVY